MCRLIYLEKNDKSRNNMINKQKFCKFTQRKATEITSLSES